MGTTGVGALTAPLHTFRPIALFWSTGIFLVSSLVVHSASEVLHAPTAALQRAWVSWPQKQQEPNQSNTLSEREARLSLGPHRNMALKHLLYLIAIVVIVSIDQNGIMLADAQKCTELSSTVASHPHGCMNGIQKFCDFGGDYSYVTKEWLDDSVAAYCPTIASGRAPGLTQFCQFMFGCSSDSDCVDSDRPSRLIPMCKDSCERFVCAVAFSCTRPKVSTMRPIAQTVLIP